MRITYIKLTGYIGIYNGLGLNELEINLAPGPNKITVISGINGCGKSTLLNAMSILPDSTSDFIPDVPAEKKLVIEDGPNRYDICITSAAGKNGSRGMSKASIQKNGVELNPNGNIGSYKEIVFDEFDLDSNYIALSRLSSDDRGLADKSPAERKKFMSFIIDSLDTYNAIYKNLNKKSSIFKSYINNLHNKIQTIGDEDAIRASQGQLIGRANDLDARLTQLKTQYARDEAMMVSLDPNSKLLEEYSTTKEEYEKWDSIRNEARSSLDRMLSCMNPVVTEEDLQSEYEEAKAKLDDLKIKETVNATERAELINRLEALFKNINNSSTRIDNLQKNVDPELKETVEEIKKKISDEESFLNSINIDPDSISKEELQIIYNTIQGIINMVDHLYDDMTDEKMAKMLEYNDASIELLDAKIQTQTGLLNKVKTDLNTLERDQEKLTDLDKRPDDCTIDYCPYIKAACDLKSSKYATEDIRYRLAEAYDNYSHLDDEITDLMAESMELRNIAKSVNYLDRIRDRLDSNADILRKTSIGKSFIDEFDDNIKNLRSFNKYRDLTDLQNAIDVLTRYKSDTRVYENLRRELEEQSNSEMLLTDLKRQLEEDKESCSILDNRIMECSSQDNIYKESIQETNERLQRLEALLNQKQKYDEANSKAEDLKKKLDDIIYKNNSCVELLKEQQNLNEEIANLTPQIGPLRSQAAKLQSQLDMLESYKEDYEMYSKKYELTEVLKKYSSPRTGIQTVFMNMYMSKTLELANNVLGMIFGGQYRLLDYVINDNEFRMPFVGSGMVVDDISSGSTSQVCMMGMVMNLVLKYQASPKYNIASLDEIDGGLDTRNRLEFISVLYKLIDILNIDQLFIISHSLEIELSNVNIIKLKSYDDFGDTSSPDEGYILYDFNKETNK